MPMNILLLGGSSEASALARRLAGDPRFRAVFSLAGRTRMPGPTPLPMRSGGFGGVAGLVRFLAAENVHLVLDATHPFAAVMSANAVRACEETGCRLLAVERPPWTEQPGDRWLRFPTAAAAAAALPPTPARVFSGLGRLELPALEAAPQHHYVVRLIDPPEIPPRLPSFEILLARGPFAVEDDIRLFRERAVTAVLAKNAGGDAAYSKIAAARHLGLPVYLVDRPRIPPRPAASSADEAWAMLAAHHDSWAKRGV